MTPEERDELTRLADERRAAVDAEYGTYVAAQDITFNGVLAYAAGMPVPVSNVRAHGYLTHGLVISAAEDRERREAAVKAAQDAAAAHEAEVEAAWQEAQGKAGVPPTEDDPPGDQPETTETPQPDGEGSSRPSNKKG